MKSRIGANERSALSVMVNAWRDGRRAASFIDPRERATVRALTKRGLAEIESTGKFEGLTEIMARILPEGLRALGLDDEAAAAAAPQKAQNFEAPARRKDPRRIAAGRKAAERRSENMFFVEQNVPPELLGIFRKVRGGLKRNKRARLDELFAEWVEAHPHDVAAMQLEDQAGFQKRIESLAKRCNALTEKARQEIDDPGEMGEATIEGLSKCAIDLGPDYEPHRIEDFFTSTKKQAAALVYSEEVPF